MNDLVFVMYNIKLKERQMKRDRKAALEFQDIDSDDEWITEKEDPVLPLNNDWLHSLDRITRREARAAAEENIYNGVETIARNISDACKYTCYLVMTCNIPDARETLMYIILIYMQVVMTLDWTMKMKLTMEPTRTENTVQSQMKMMIALILPLQL
jgi:hypothetical protein